MSSTITTTLPITGMTCGHCVSAVTQELTQLDGVQDVAVELVPDGTSRVTVTSANPLDGDAVRAAIDEAGYDVAR
jgi:copper chaperone